MAALVCPYCYDSFKERDIEFRCTGRTSRLNKTCQKVRDPKLAERIGSQQALPPAFRDNGRRRKATCRACGEESAYRICPRCHSRLPVNFGKVSSQLIAMVGARYTGKTVYMTVLIHELQNRVGKHFGAAVVGSDDETLRRFSLDYERRLYGAGQLFSTTPSAATRTAGLVAPLVFSFTIPRPCRFPAPLPGRARSRQSLLSFFDTAGEDQISQDNVERNARYLASADGIILLLDPLQMPGARRLAAPGVPLPDLGPNPDRPVHVLVRVTRMLQERLPLRPGEPIPKPLAVAFSKLDALWHRFPAGSPLRVPESEAAHFDVEDSLAVHEYVRAQLHDWDGAQIDNIVQQSYRQYRYFGLSGLGESPTRDNRVSDRAIRPYRVSDPFLWLLSEFGTIPKSTGRGVT
jgi:hypothetical protein